MVSRDVESYFGIINHAGLLHLESEKKRFENGNFMVSSNLLDSCKLHH